eukprot:TRINITY_DN635_c0_g1::TRINITY_DN635_c0_g1_i1::g.28905::m.28905 TRINITY_DN635_c0_g1::TRINITY_DN635_c0_g1_i1::g.28905  ORF type:complete len:461 (+),score=136.42,sp/Q9Y041/HGD_CAEEL/59.12/4e-180,HgmA/PF04209.8/5.7e-186 TRINITY_DN635_c0_g1_i1:62-1384(+)
MTVHWESLKYQVGLQQEFASEALPDALPKGQNSPQKCPYGLYCEQLNGTAFTAPRLKNFRSWLYRIRPAVAHGPLTDMPGPHSQFVRANFGTETITPNQLRWKPWPIPEEPTDFLQGLRTVCGAGSPETKAGCIVHIFACNTSMTKKAFYNSDGDFLFVPQQGALRVRTEFGCLKVSPGEIMVIQRGIRFAVEVDGPTRGYICEVFNSHFVIPSLGPIGANGLANPRDFQTPSAWYEDVDEEFTVVTKFLGQFFQCKQDHSPFDVVAWSGNYAPFKYNLDYFCAMNTVTFDHADPSIFTVLTAPSLEEGTAVADFVIFPPRWSVAEHTFRPPWFHRNIMSEYMGLIKGEYEARPDGGFLPGGGSLHNVMTPHGPDAGAFEKNTNGELKPVKLFEGSLAFMFESCLIFRVANHAMDPALRDVNYNACWNGLKKHFNPNCRD